MPTCCPIRHGEALVLFRPPPATRRRWGAKSASSERLRSDNGSELTAHEVRDWLGRVDVKTAFIEPGSPAEHGFRLENGYLESFEWQREAF